MDNTKDIYSERSHHPAGSIAFIYKKWMSIKNVW